MTGEPLGTDKKIAFFMGRIEEHLANDALFKERYIKKNDSNVERIDDVEDRVSRVEVKQGYVHKAGYVLITTIIALFTKGYWKGH